MFRLQTKIEKTNLKLLTTSELSLTLSSLPNLVVRVVFFYVNNHEQVTLFKYNQE